MKQEYDITYRSYHNVVYVYDVCCYDFFCC